ncbi:MAG TPA: dienelactone hydrolase family protein, partial [Gemmatimonadales bacterium]|nr:dienelactone hydrolase family protein [Gemmatimonadales bacterium]
MKALAGLGGAVAVAAAVALSVPPTADIHTEYVKYASGRDTVTAYVAYPERKDAAPAVVVIHEIFGMSDFVRQTTEQLAKDGFVAIAPDLLSRRGGTPQSSDDARKLIAGLAPDTVTQDLDATVAYVKRLKAVRPDRVGVIGFCWGGGQSFRYATN